MALAASTLSVSAVVNATTSSVNSLLQIACDQYLENVAIDEGNRRLTYAQVRMQANALHAELVGVLPQAGLVIVLGHRSAEVIAAAWAVWMAGCTLMLIDDALPEQRRALMAELQPAVATIDCRGDDPVIVRTANLSGVSCICGPVDDPSQTDLAYVVFTSGSTGRPKAILGSHNGLSHFLKWQRDEFSIGPQDRFAHLTNLSFDVWFRDAFTPLISGATLCIPPARLLSAVEMVDWLQAQAITALHVVPSVANHWMNYAGSRPANSLLRLAFFAGEPLEGVLVRRWCMVFTTCQVINLYGPTETTLAKLYKRVSAHASDGVQPVGLPLPETRAYILDENLAQCDDGVHGEICIATDYRSHGYLDQQRLVPTFVYWISPELEPCWIYRTGDIGLRRADGEFEILGRKDDQVKINGVRIELLEIKSLIASWPGVRDVFVCTVLLPQGLAIAAVVEGESRIADELTHMLRQRLPAVMVPTRFLIERILPRLPNGKLDRTAARAMAERVPAPSLPQMKSFSDGLADQVADIWKDLLSLNYVESTRNFFELGGNSMTIAELHVRIEQHFQIKFPLVRLFEHASVTTQAALIAQLRGLSVVSSNAPSNGDITRRQLRSRAIGVRQR